VTERVNERAHVLLRDDDVVRVRVIVRVFREIETVREVDTEPVWVAFTEVVIDRPRDRDADVVREIVMDFVGVADAVIDDVSVWVDDLVVVWLSDIVPVRVSVAVRDTDRVCVRAKVTDNERFAVTVLVNAKDAVPGALAVIDAFGVFDAVAERVAASDRVWLRLPNDDRLTVRGWVIVTGRAQKTGLTNSMNAYPLALVTFMSTCGGSIWCAPVGLQIAISSPIWLSPENSGSTLTTVNIQVVTLEFQSTCEGTLSIRYKMTTSSSCVALAAMPVPESVTVTLEVLLSSAGHILTATVAAVLAKPNGGSRNGSSIRAGAVGTLRTRGANFTRVWFATPWSVAHESADATATQSSTLKVEAKAARVTTCIIHLSLRKNLNAGWPPSPGHKVISTVESDE
jgi:hypothetical protein